MPLRLIIGSFLSVLIISSCFNGSSNEYELPEKVVLQYNQLYSPVFIEYIFDHSGKYAQFWNDSILNITGVNSISFSSSNPKKPGNNKEKYFFLFSLKSKLKSFEYFNYELADDPQTKIEFDGNSGKTVSFFGEKTSLENKFLTDGQPLIHLRGRSNNSYDSTFIFGSYITPELVLEKTGDSFIKASVFINENTPVRKCKDILERNGYSIEVLATAEINVTYLNSKGLPVKSYLISDNFVQSQLIAEWSYEVSGMLTGFKRFINNTLVKSIHFNYSKDHLLREVVYNEVPYSVEYNH